MSCLSVVMIVKNEAEVLVGCLASVRAIADEIVVGDTGSTDETVSIARGFGARVIEVPWTGDFAAARNCVLRAATGNWLLHLDADEALDEANANHIRAVVDADGGGADAIEVTLANYCDEPRAWRWVAVMPGDPAARGASGYIAAPLLRLFRNGRGFEYHEPVHENITESVVEKRGIIRAEPILIHHYGFGRPSASKAKQYLEIGQRKVRERPEDPKAWHDLSEQLLGCGDAAGAESAARRVLAIDALHLGACITLANLLLNRGDTREARTLLERVEAAGPCPPHVVAALGAIAVKEGRLQEARTRLAAVLHAVPTHVMARLYLARTLDLEGDFAAARLQLEQAVSHTPGLEEPRNRLSAHALRHQGEEAARSGRLPEALGLLVKALSIDPEDPIIHNDIGVVALELGDAERARAGFERALRLAPAMREARGNLDALGGATSPKD